MDYNCPICQCPMFKPSKLAGCRHTFCRGCFKRWLKVTPCCPLCRAAGNQLIPVRYSNEEVDCSFCDERIPHGDMERHERRKHHRRCVNCLQPMDQGEERFCSLHCKLAANLMPYSRAMYSNKFVKDFIETENICENDVRKFSQSIGQNIFKIYDRLNQKFNFTAGNISETLVLDTIISSQLSQLNKILAAKVRNNYEVNHRWLVLDNRDALFIVVEYDVVVEERESRNEIAAVL